MRWSAKLAVVQWLRMRVLGMEVPGSNSNKLVFFDIFCSGWLCQGNFCLSGIDITMVNNDFGDILYYLTFTHNDTYMHAHATSPMQRIV